jgi:hypothetical protein
MIGTLAALVVAMQAAPARDWTWTLYDGDHLVLAHEVPDTPQLRATLECDTGSGVARISAYGAGAGAAFATLTSGRATASAEVQPTRGSTPRTAVMLPVNHPVFAAFNDSGVLTIRTGSRSDTVTVPRAHLGKLRRFAQLCGG